MTSTTRRRFTQDFKLEAAQLVINQGYSVREAASAMNVGSSTIDKWVRQLKNDGQGIADQPKALTHEQNIRHPYLFL